MNHYMKRAVDLAMKNVKEGGHPFGAATHLVPFWLKMGKSFRRESMNFIKRMISAAMLN
ncbi:hypothetical protein GCM10010954_17050 [Halobacillus andaensis]|uniref:Uncharacterized protein n=1 Tax=Halobacillus andaensis TaxID=1176239 RepID=A0A917EXB9_HALAA|nr:tRNA(Arg) A34 adenosine deaminase TadA [Halobacillus andaensis]GGF18835.1 hypothetical protein GCM10010954_17050 [Halobacillus andaensis]